MIKRVVNSFAFGQVLVIGLCAGIVLVAAIIAPSSEMLTLFGREIPVMCSFRTTFGMGCPGCGLTRSFVYLAHGGIIEAFRMNLLGPPLFALCAGQIPYRMWLLYRGPRRRMKLERT